MDPRREISDGYDPGEAYDRVLAMSLDYRPDLKQLKDHAVTWAENKGHDENTTNAYGSWYADTYEGHKWAEMPSHALGFRRFAQWLEKNSLSFRHPTQMETHSRMQRYGLVEREDHPEAFLFPDKPEEASGPELRIHKEELDF